MNTEQLNTEYAIPGQLKFIQGAGGLPFIEVTTANSSALISVYAGQVLSFRPAGEMDDLMFLSEKAYYQTGKAIKGGAPVCWPWFGADPQGLGRPAHGFVRNRMWNVVATEITVSGAIRVILGLEDTPETIEIWPQSFTLMLEITVGKSLNLELVTRNTGAQLFPVTQAFHTYFKVGDISQVSVSGLEDTDYIDKVDNSALKKQIGPVVINEEVDRIYLGVRDELVINDIALKRRIRIRSGGSKTAVVWNPWAKISAEMADLQDNDYRNLLCAETTNAATDVVEVSPGRESRLVANYSIERT
ncbi:MAG: putative glucose-6-phosphate 1-epimerase [Nitrosomonadaceae bacterium]|nr:D-hexose-6-phosphate mutarotase [Nitrosospira sp.]MBI0413512.1 D-hexose-6-phosphate mutarotase [Nitrosospira sp.]MCG3769917.1 putative glucose-6-phosphate 1-epimerase [Nitrosomonadaceae bacterium]GDX60326.1 D-hexose-6-phosphate mutarotase [Nitrosomonadaceae bacterium]